MHDFSVFRTVSGPYDVPLDDPKPRFGQQRRKNRPRPCNIHGLGAASLWQPYPDTARPRVDVPSCLISTCKATWIKYLCPKPAPYALVVEARFH